MKIYFVVAFATIIVLSNFLFQYQINNWLTWGAVLFPISFLMTDIIGEKYGKETALKVVKNGIFMAIIPTFLITDFRIAIASILAYWTAQTLDVLVFSYLKQKHSNLWWLRNNVSTFVSQFMDTVVFFIVAFCGKIENEVLFSLIIGAVGVKWCIAIIDTPLFYIFVRSTR